MVAAGSQIRGYKVREFAELSGVTVRALHHYDRLGLLRPKRTRNGYRAYNEQDLVRLEQIVALKFVGLPLRRIKALLDRDELDFAGALRMQRQSAGGQARSAGSSHRSDSSGRNRGQSWPAAGRRDSDQDHRGDGNAKRCGMDDEILRRRGAGKDRRAPAVMVAGVAGAGQPPVAGTDPGRGSGAGRRSRPATKGRPWLHAGPAWWKSSRAAIRRSPAA